MTGVAPGGPGTSTESALNVGPGTHTVTVGGGGDGAPAGGDNNRGNSGANSVFSTIIAQGGGGGGSESPIDGSQSPGWNGGSGGGGAGQYVTSTTPINTPTATPIAVTIGNGGWGASKGPGGNAGSGEDSSVAFPAGTVTMNGGGGGGDESAGTSNQLWREDSTAGTINITLINANAKVYFSCMQGDCFSSGGCTIVTEMAARAGSSNLSVTDPQDDSGAIRWPKRHQYRLTADDDRVMFVEGVMDVTNSANEAWCFGPTCYACLLYTSPSPRDS